MTKTDQFSLDKYVVKPDALVGPEMIILYGPPGGGKTWLAASASDVPGLDPVLIIDTENSTQGTITAFDSDKIDVIRPAEQFPKDKLYAATKAIINGLLTKDHKYCTVIIDTADVLFEWAKREGDTPGDGFAKWNFVHDELTAPGGMFHALKRAPFLTILVIHENESDGSDGLTKSTFQWQGQGKSIIGGIPDMVGYVTRETNMAGVTTTTLHTAPTKRNVAKNRFGLPAKISNPTMSMLYGLISGKIPTGNVPEENNAPEGK